MAIGGGQKKFRAHCRPAYMLFTKVRLLGATSSRAVFRKTDRNAYARHGWMVGTAVSETQGLVVNVVVERTLHPTDRHGKLN